MSNASSAVGYNEDMLLWVPLFTLFLASASEQSQARRRRRLRPPDMRWLELQARASDLAIAGMDYDLIEWLVDLGMRAGVPTLLDRAAVERMQRSLQRVDGARVVVDPRTGFWSVRHGDWVIVTEPWCTECLMGSPTARGRQIPASTGGRLVLYQEESERRRRTTGEGVPVGASDLLAELWLPAAPLRPNPLGLDYNVVQVSVWRAPLSTSRR